MNKSIKTKNKNNSGIAFLVISTFIGFASYAYSIYTAYCLHYVYTWGLYFSIIAILMGSIAIIVVKYTKYFYKWYGWVLGVMGPCFLLLALALFTPFYIKGNDSEMQLLYKDLEYDYYEKQLYYENGDLKPYTYREIFYRNGDFYKGYGRRRSKKWEKHGSGTYYNAQIGKYRTEVWKKNKLTYTANWRDEEKNPNNIQ